MNRLSPLIVRRAGIHAIAVSAPLCEPVVPVETATWLDDLRLFVTGWIGGLIFFGTLLS